MWPFKRSKFSFEPKWKEELVCRTPSTVFTVELTMGVLHVYFPDEAKWKKDVPEHLHGQWTETVRELEQWCLRKNIALSIVPDAWIVFHDKKNP